MSTAKTKENLSVDICIIGAAGAGLTAAVRAKECGAKKVLILEKMKRIGGCTVWASGMLAINSPVQSRMGLFYDLDKVYLDLMYIAHWDCNTKLVRKWFDKSADIIRWLQAKGINYEIDPVDESFPPGKFPGYHRNNSAEKDRLGIALVKMLEKECQEKGVEIRIDTRAKKLLTDDKGSVVGVLATQGDKELKISAKSVILASGSISNNPELMARFYPPEHYNFKNVYIMASHDKHNTGDGLLMAEEIGAATRPVHTLYIGPQSHPHSTRTAMILKQPEMIKLTQDGERYQDEAVQSQSNFPWMAGKAQNYIPGAYTYSLMDESIYRNMMANYRATKTTIYRGLRHWDEDNDILRKEIEQGGPLAWIDGMDNALRSEQENGRVRIADTLDEIAKFIGCEANTLKTTVAEYNSFCHNKHDAEFCKNPKYLFPLTTPPYYVFKAPPAIDTCIGGIRVNHRLEVVKKEDEKPIKGLYAAGVCAGGWLPKDAYSYSGSEMGFVCYSGYTTGEAAAKLVSDA